MLRHEFAVLRRQSPLRSRTGPIGRYSRRWSDCCPNRCGRTGSSPRAPCSSGANAASRASGPSRRRRSATDDPRTPRPDHPTRRGQLTLGLRARPLRTVPPRPQDRCLDCSPDPALQASAQRPGALPRAGSGQPSCERRLMGCSPETSFTSTRLLDLAGLFVRHGGPYPPDPHPRGNAVFYGPLACAARGTCCRISGTG